MVRKNRFRLLVILFVLVGAALAWSVTVAQQAQPTAQPTVKPAAQPTTAPAANAATSAEHPYLGIRLEDTASGIIVREVMPNSPAAKAGILLDDIVQKVNGTAVTNAMDTAKIITALKVGDAVKLDVMRAGKPMTLNATMGSTSAMVLEGLPSTIAFEAMGYNNADQSWQVLHVAETSDLYTAGLRDGDTIKQFNGKAYDPAGLRTFMGGLTDADSVKAAVERGGKSQDITIPAKTLKALDLFDNSAEGILLGVASGTATQPSALPLLGLPSTQPFVGIGYDSADKGWHVYGVGDGSDFFTAGLRPEDIITQFDGKAYDPAALQTYRQGLADDATVKLTIERAGKPQDMSVSAAALNSLALLNEGQGGLLMALPISTAKAWLGADVQNLTDAIAKEHQLTISTGLLITGVMPDSPAAKAGLQMNDVITGVDTTKLDATHSWQTIIATHKPGDALKLDVLRAGKDMQLQATLGTPIFSGEIPNLTPAF
jgi:S1-C subfamily serine protease